jgi:hypothetical protein
MTAKKKWNLHSEAKNVFRRPKCNTALTGSVYKKCEYKHGDFFLAAQENLKFEGVLLKKCIRITSYIFCRRFGKRKN